MVLKAVIRSARCAQRTLGPLAAAALLGAAGWAPAQDAVPSTVPRLDEAAALAAGQAVIGSTPSDFTFLDRQGKPVRLSQYRGKPLLVSFIYTGCFEICPATTRNLHEAVKGLDKLLSPNQFNVVSIGFNQPADSPVALRSFATQYGIKYPNWEFLSPHARIVEPLTRAFGFSYLATPAGFDHVLGVTVLDADGKIATQVWGDKLTAQQLGEMNAFFATPTGRAYSAEWMALQADPEVMLAMIKAVPPLINKFVDRAPQIEGQFKDLPKEKQLGDLSDPDLAKLAKLMKVSVKELKDHRDQLNAPVEEAADAAEAIDVADDVAVADPAYDRENWSQADRQRVEALEDAASEASEAAYDAQEQAVANARMKKPST